MGKNRKALGGKPFEDNTQAQANPFKGVVLMMVGGHNFSQDSRSGMYRLFSRIPSLKIIKFLDIARLYPLAFVLIALTYALGHSESTTQEKNQPDESSKTEYNLYRNVSRAQSDLAHRALNQAYSGKPKSAHKTLVVMEEMESAKHLPPLSYLLSIAVDVMRFQDGDCENAEEEKELLQSILATAEEGRRLCDSFLKKNPDHPTYLLIIGGIRGFLATLKIHINPRQALSDGFQALKLLESSRDMDSRIKDSYMGTGIFNCTAANAPIFVRATLKMIGRSVSMKTGLDGLRVSAYRGQYTSVASQLFLIQFLSPYEEELKREKREIFKSLETSFPRNAYYTFLKSDEALSFYPDSFYTTANRHALAARIAAFGTFDFSSKRYANLVRYQYTLLDPHPDKNQTPDTNFQFRDYTFYPAFIEGLRYKHRVQDTLGVGETPPKKAIADLKEWRETCLDLIGDSPMNPTRKRYYKWHVKEALSWDPIKSDDLPPEKEEQANDR